MGKYDKEKELKDNSKNIQRDLFWIANELAEANRLKRVELNHLFPQLKGHTRQELEDKA